MKYRKVSDVWKLVESQKPDAVSVQEWRRSYDGIAAVMQAIGLQLATSRREFDELEIPLDAEGCYSYTSREVIVTRDGIDSQPTRISHLLSGNSSLQTADEKRAMNQEKSIRRSAALPKGTATSNHMETLAYEALLEILNLRSDIECAHLWEHRLADVALRKLIQQNEGFSADQVKTAQIDTQGRFNFHHGGIIITVKMMISILQQNICLVFIGKDLTAKIHLIWMLHGSDTINLLQKFPADQAFRPRLGTGTTALSHFMYQQCYRFDLNLCQDIDRLRAAKLQTIEQSQKHPLSFWNEDESQIPSKTHQLEHKSFVMTREACAKLHVLVEHFAEDFYGSVDFRVAKTARIQDKNGDKQINFRHPGRHPLNPDDVDVLQISNQKLQQVYAIPMRMVTDDTVVSTFSSHQLMLMTLTCSQKWKDAHIAHRYDLKKTADVKAYIEACVSAVAVPQLTDRNFYSNMIRDNAAKFGSKKALAAGKIAISKKS